MSWWSGLTVTGVRSGIELAGAALERHRIEGGELFAAAGAFEPTAGLVPHPFVRLLSNYDEFLGSYADASPILDASFPKARTIGDVLGGHLVVRDGLVVGGWRRALSERGATVSVTLLVPFSRADHGALEAEAERYEHFLGMPVDLRVATR
jgi:winged helix DNA-binding protein